MSINEEKNMERPRGRPKRSDIAFLIVQGMKSQSGIKCDICGRVFPRLKSLHAHILTHNDVKKYKCSFPHCMKSFKQSSQLKNHVYLHSKEKPFKCPADGCMVRYAHTHRICPSHPKLKLVKQLETAEEIRFRFYQNTENLSEDDVKWFEEYLAERERKLRQVLVERKKNVEDSQEKDCTKSDQEINIPQQIQQKLQNIRTNFNDVLLLWAFLQDVHEKGENSKALFEKSCNSVIVQNWSDSLCEQLNFEKPNYHQ